MAVKLAELKTALERLSDEGLRLVLEFAEYLKKHGEKKTGNLNVAVTSNLQISRIPGI